MKSLFKTVFCTLGILVVSEFVSCKVHLNVIQAPSYTVAFETNGGSAIPSQSVTEGNKAIIPDNPSKPDTENDRFVFDAWYTSADDGITLSEQPFNFNTPIKNNITLYAKWNRTDITYTVTYATPWGTAPEAITVVKNAVLTDGDLSELSDDGFVFLGWYDGSTKVLAGDYTVTNDVVLSARWDYTEPLTFEFLAAGTITITSRWPTLKYSRNGGKLTLATDSITVKKKEKISFYAEAANGGGMNIKCSSDCYIYGNIMSLVTLIPDSEACDTTITSVTNFAFSQLFKDNTHIKNHPTKQLYLPATTLGSGCYINMFWGCSSLTQAPSLPATNLADNCYCQMFWNCTNLIQAPSLLPATSLANFCYLNMFCNCRSLTEAPSLPATNLADSCYSGMFYQCTTLTQAPSLPATNLARGCYGYMFYGCTSLAQTPALPATNLAESCYNGMFSSCTSLTEAPSLPATNLAESCYSNMFFNCTTLTQAPSLPATNLARGCYSYMFYGCYSIIFVECLATDISANNCTKNWLSNVSATGTFIKAKGMTAWTTGENGIPLGWTVKEE